MSGTIHNRTDLCITSSNSSKQRAADRQIGRTGRSFKAFTCEKELSDGFLLNQISSGDSDCFWLLWMRYEKYLHTLYLRLCKGNRQDVDDTLSGFCLRLNSHIQLFAASIVNFKTWLRRSAYNYFIDTHRSLKRTPVASGSLEELALIMDAKAASTRSDPEANIINRQLLNRTLNAIEQLGSDQQRKAMHMRFIEERSYGEIAEALSVSEPLVRKWVQCMRSKLRVTISY